MIEAQKTGDAGRVRSTLSQRPDAVHIGTGARAWWTGTQLADAVAAADGGDDIQVAAGAPGIHVHDDVAWVHECRPR